MPKQETLKDQTEASRNSLGISAKAAVPTPSIPSFKTQAAVCLYRLSNAGRAGLPCETSIQPSDPHTTKATQKTPTQDILIQLSSERDPRLLPRDLRRLPARRERILVRNDAKRAVEDHAHLAPLVRLVVRLQALPVRNRRAQRGLILRQRERRGGSDDDPAGRPSPLRWGGDCGGGAAAAATAPEPIHPNPFVAFVVAIHIHRVRPAPMPMPIRDPMSIPSSCTAHIPLLAPHPLLQLRRLQEQLHELPAPELEQHEPVRAREHGGVEPRGLREGRVDVPADHAVHDARAQLDVAVLQPRGAAVGRRAGRGGGERGGRLGRRRKGHLHVRAVRTRLGRGDGERRRGPVPQARPQPAAPLAHRLERARRLRVPVMRQVAQHQLVDRPLPRLVPLSRRTLRSGHSSFFTGPAPAPEELGAQRRPHDLRPRGAARLHHMVLDVEAERLLAEVDARRLCAVAQADGRVERGGGAHVFEYHACTSAG